MADSVLYLGDTSLQDAAAYLAGLLNLWEWEFDYVPSDRAAGAELFESGRSSYVLSDYPAENLADDLQRKIVEDVATGAGLLMVGGWESFHGTGGNWDGTAIGEILPVDISAEDDRVNCDHPVLVARTGNHPAIEDLPWEERPPVIGGFNRVTAKPDSQLLLEARHFRARREDDAFTFEPAGTDPLLVVGKHGAGKVAAFTTDVAPHWVGPLVDWGDARVTAQAPDANGVEVGDLYAQFLRQLLGSLRRS